MKSGEYINKYGIKQRLYYRVKRSFFYKYRRTIFYRESIVGIKSKFNWKKFKFEDKSFEKYEKLFEIDADINDFHISAKWWDEQIQKHLDFLERKKDILCGNIWRKNNF